MMGHLPQEETWNWPMMFLQNPQGTGRCSETTLNRLVRRVCKLFAAAASDVGPPLMKIITRNKMYTVELVS